MKMKKTAYDRFLEERQEMLEEITILVNSDNPEKEIQELKQNRKNKNRQENNNG
ncbi:hypothetical protein VSVS12_00230 [Vibrio scophthalmi]|nr:hypothetical protein VSVS12_00230 [Vibrio scophthalmi]